MHDFAAAWSTGDFARRNKEVSRALSEPKNSADASRRENVDEEREREREDRPRRVAADRKRRMMEPRGKEGEEIADRNEGVGGVAPRKSLPSRGLARKRDGDARTIDKAGFRCFVAQLLSRKRAEDGNMRREDDTMPSALGRSYFTRTVILAIIAIGAFAIIAAPR